MTERSLVVVINLPLPDSAMDIHAANTDRQMDTDPHMVNSPLGGEWLLRILIYQLP